MIFKLGKETKIKEITHEGIIFENGEAIIHRHIQDCCERVYADWEYIKRDISPFIKCDEIKIEPVEKSGFRIQFGDNHYPMFVPCYNEQNGYYGDSLSLELVNEEVLKEGYCGAWYDFKSKQSIDISDSVLDQIYR